MVGMNQRDSILSHEERAIARLLREDPDATPESIADARDADVTAVERSIRRIREKTDRAVATLVQSPFLEEATSDLEPEDRERIRSAVDEQE